MVSPRKMSQSQTASTGRTALAIGVVALIIGASALGYAVYLGLSQLPSQLSAVTVNVPCSTSQPCANKTIRIDWTLDDSGQDRFNPQYATVIQGDNLTIMFITNDTTDAHTFTLNLGLRGFSSSTLFQLNNSWTGLSSGDFILPGTPGYNLNFTGKPDGCTDNNGGAVACNTQKMDDTANGGTGPNGACNNTLENPPTSSAPPCDLWSIGYLGVVTVPGVYEFHCFYHQKGGMIGYITVLPNKGFST